MPACDVQKPSENGTETETGETHWLRGRRLKSGEAEIFGTSHVEQKRTKSPPQVRRRKRDGTRGATHETKLNHGRGSQTLRICGLWGPSRFRAGGGTSKGI
jgi:hypothetical protein